MRELIKLDYKIADTICYLNMYSKPIRLIYLQFQNLRCRFRLSQDRDRRIRYRKYTPCSLLSWASFVIRNCNLCKRYSPKVVNINRDADKKIELNVQRFFCFNNNFFTLHYITNFNVA